MRKDIEIHINTGDITLSAKNTYKTYPFSWVDAPNALARYIYGEITLPDILSEKVITRDGFHIAIPYTPIYKEFCIRIKRISDNGRYSYVQNPVDGTEWFVVQCGLYGTPKTNIYASQLFVVSELSYYIKLNEGVAELYSSIQSDVRIIEANKQNTNLLLSCVPTNNYRYPLSGVGLIRWLKSNIDHTKLTETLQHEFEKDGVSIKNASFDFDTKDLHLEIDTTKID